MSDRVAAFLRKKMPLELWMYLVIVSAALMAGGLLGLVSLILGAVLLFLVFVGFANIHPSEKKDKIKVRTFEKKEDT